MKYVLSIKHPCNENWDQMQLLGGKRHCEKCDRCLVDFTRFSDRELSRYLANNPDVCGRFLNTQLDRPINDFQPKKHSIRGVLMSLFVSSAGIPASAQVNNPEKISVEHSNVYTNDSTYVVSGVVEEGGFSMPGVTVTDMETNRYTQTDIDGRYELTIQKDSIQVHRIAFSFIGFETKIVAAQPESTQVNINLTMEQTQAMLGIVRPKRNIFQRFFDLFRR